MSLEASCKVTSDRYLAALKAVYEVRDNPHAVATLIFEAISPLGAVDEEDLEWARTEIERIERKS